MKMKSFVLGAAAVLAATGANAADLGAKAPAEAADYVKICDAYGAGYFYIPGGETCLKIGGYVRADYRLSVIDNNVAPVLGGGLGNGWSTRGGNGTTTRARARVEFDARTNTDAGLLRSFIAIHVTTDSGGATGVALDRGFIQWAGITAGRTGSFFGFGGNQGAMGMVSGNFISGANDDATNLLAYTASFGNGISATLSLEDATFIRRGGGYGGHKLPDLVANVAVTQAWGSAQVMAAAHQLYPAAAGVASKMGWAIGAGVSFNIPGMSGAAASLEAAYTEGALGYLNAGGLAGDFAVAGGRVRATKAYMIRGGISAPVASNVRVAADLGYGSADPFGPNNTTDVLVARGSIAYTATPGLTFTFGLDYTNVLKATPVVNEGQTLAAGFRIQRNF